MTTTTTTTGTANPRQLATLPDILARLSVIQSDEAGLSAALAGLLSAHEPIATSLGSLKQLGPQVDLLTRETRLLDLTVAATARTAQDVGGRVQSLDEEMRRVRDASERVSQVIELKVHYLLKSSQIHHLPQGIRLVFSRGTSQRD
ncbi:hypothetical protein ONZ51_g13384 [Trametes cubensis]|uniref:Conserved oligomeric Golgi complex subunit 4 N-terminal domain-containing protein n=1 Tax=Trametes cubensis TaxID=1111947 RepID=A0AAD7X364_9APHY|nr:hypothetical protein ONZ51_g13384 [Trametes cubensis]